MSFQIYCSMCVKEVSSTCLMICVRLVAFLVGLSIVQAVVVPHVTSAMTGALRHIKPVYITAVRDY